MCAQTACCRLRCTSRNLFGHNKLDPVSPLARWHLVRGSERARVTVNRKHDEIWRFLSTSHQPPAFRVNRNAARLLLGWHRTDIAKLSGAHVHGETCNGAARPLRCEQKAAIRRQLNVSTPNRDGLVERHRARGAYRYPQVMRLSPRSVPSAPHAASRQLSNAGRPIPQFPEAVPRRRHPT